MTSLPLDPSISVLVKVTATFAGGALVTVMPVAGVSGANEGVAVAMTVIIGVGFTVGVG